MLWVDGWDTFGRLHHAGLITFFLLAFAVLWHYFMPPSPSARKMTLCWDTLGQSER